MNKSFKGQNISFFIRLLKRLAPVFLILIIAYFKIFHSKTFSGDLAKYKIHFSILMIIAFFIGVYFHIDKIRTIVKEVRFIDDKFLIIGHDFNRHFEVNYDLNKMLIEIQSEELGKNKIQYCLELYYDDKFYYLNKFNDWKYSILVEIIDEYQSRTGKTVNGMEYYSELKASKN